ncbi:hypothetical protein OIU78_013233 [Salix suchowensis]|nr:hypothetical protein OIU78_013233 [Salix suchowensis]
MNSILKLLNDFISSESTRESSSSLDYGLKLARSLDRPVIRFLAMATSGSRENFIDLLWESHDKYGSVFKLWLEINCLAIGKAFRLAFGRSSLFFCSYDQAQKGRESLAMELDDKLLGKANVISKNVVNCIMEGVDASMNIGSVDCKLISQHMAFTILGTSLFGDTFLAWSKATFYEELLMMIAKDASFWASYRFTPFWKRGFWRYQSLCTDLKCLTLDIAQQCGKNHKLSCHMDRNSHIGTANDKFFSQELGGDINAREEPCGNIMGLMFHGCIATTSFIGSILERLVADAEIQDKIYSEIMKVKQGSVREDQDVEEMHFVIGNYLRISPSSASRTFAAEMLFERCNFDFLLYQVTDKRTSDQSLVPITMDGSSWGSDASKFNPYRFLSKAVKGSDSVHDTSSTEEAADPIQCSLVLNDPNDNAAFLPFGSGMRTCVGQKFVIRGVATLFASLLEHYEVRLHPQLGNGSKSTAGPEIVFARRSR